MKVKNLLLASTFAIGALSTNAYDLVKRAKLTDDRFKTMDITRDLGHDFYLNVSGWMSMDAMDLKDDAEKIDKIDSTLSTTDQIAQVNKILDKYYDKEQLLRINAGLGFPIFSFEAFGAKIEPNFRMDASLLAMLTPRKTKLTMSDIITNLDQIPVELRTKLSSCLSGLTIGNDGDDLLTICVPSALTQVEADSIRATYDLTEIPYSHSLATTSTETPLIDVYAKAEVKGGLFFDYKKGTHWFGKLGLYTLYRVDVKKRADALLLLGGGGDIETADNGLANLALDYRFGYKNSNYSVFAAIEEMTVAELSKSDKGEPLNFGDDMLLRLHAQADYKPAFFKLSPYAGFHKRDGYGIGDAYYLGADWGMYFFDDRLGLNLKTQMDKEHITLGLRAKIWIIHADLTGKFPIASEIDGVKVQGYYGGNVRIFF